MEVSGAPQNEVEIAVLPDRLTAHGVGLNDLSTRLQTVNFSVSAGEIDDGGQRLRVQPVGEITDLQQLRDLVIAKDGTRLGDIADVRLKPGETDADRRLDGERAVGLDIFKERNANLVQVSRDALAEVNAIRAQPDLSDLQVKIIQDLGDNVTSSLTELAEAGGIGLLLSITVLYFFLRHWPSTLMVTLAIPICFVMTLGFMYFAGVTLNILSMMGLLLAVGMLVDNAVVVVEHLPGTRAHARPAAAGLDPRHPPRRHRADRGHAVPLHRVRAQPVRRTQLPQHLPLPDRDHHLGVAAGVVAGRGQPDPDAVGAAEDPAGGARRARPDPAPAEALRDAAALDAGTPWLERGGHRVDHRDQHRADGADQEEHVRRRRRRRDQHLLPVEGQLHQGADVDGNPAGRGFHQRQPQALPRHPGVFVVERAGRRRHAPPSTPRRRARPNR